MASDLSDFHSSLMAFNFTKMFRSSKERILEGKAAALWQLDALDGWFQVMAPLGIVALKSYQNSLNRHGH